MISDHKRYVLGGHAWQRFTFDIACIGLLAITVPAQAQISGAPSASSEGVRLPSDQVIGKLIRLEDYHATRAWLAARPELQQSRMVAAPAVDTEAQTSELAHFLTAYGFSSEQIARSFSLSQGTELVDGYAGAGDRVLHGKGTLHDFAALASSVVMVRAEGPRYDETLGDGMFSSADFTVVKAYQGQNLLGRRITLRFRSGLRPDGSRQGMSSDLTPVKDEVLVPFLSRPLYNYRSTLASGTPLNDTPERLFFVTFSAPYAIAEQGRFIPTGAISTSYADARDIEQVLSKQMAGDVQ